MVGKTLLLLIDIQLLDIVDQFLLQTVLIIIYRKLLQRIEDTFLDLRYSIFLIRFYGSQQLAYASDVCAEFPIQRLTLLLAEIQQMLNSFLHSCKHCIPLFFSQFHSLILSGHHIRHSQQSGKPILRSRNACFLHYLCQTLIISRHRALVDGYHHIGSFFFLYPQSEIHLSAFNLLSNIVANLHLLFSIQSRHTS